MVTVEDEIRFYAQTLGDAERTILCEPDRVDDVRTAVEQMGVSHLLTVRASVSCPTGKLLVLDEQALQASMHQTFQRAAKSIRMHS